MRVGYHCCEAELERLPQRLFVVVSDTHVVNSNILLYVSFVRTMVHLVVGFQQVSYWFRQFAKNEDCILKHKGTKTVC